MKNLKNYIEKELLMKHNLAVTGLERVIRGEWRIYTKAADRKTHLVTLKTIKCDHAKADRTG